jgi:hypothetical protein
VNNPPRRTLLGRTSSFTGRHSVYAIDDGLEIDENDAGMITRKRVYYDDVLFVTLHRHRGVAFLVVSGMAAFFLGLIALAIGASGNTAAGIVFALCCSAPLAIVFLIRSILGVDVVSVFGKRTMGDMRFTFRKSRARQVYQLICDQARRRQDDLAAEIAREHPPVEAPLPPALAPPAGAESATPTETGVAPPAPAAPPVPETGAELPSQPPVSDAMPANDVTPSNTAAPIDADRWKVPEPPAVPDIPSPKQDTHPGETSTGTTNG